METWVKIGGRLDWQQVFLWPKTNRHMGRHEINKPECTRK